MTVTVENKRRLENRKSPSDLCMCEVLNQQWPSTQIVLLKHERTRQSAQLDVLRDQLTRSEWILVYWNTSFLQEFWNQYHRQNPSKMLLSTRPSCDVFKISHFQNKNGLLKPDVIGPLITKLIRRQTFWEAVCFTASPHTAFMLDFLYVDRSQWLLPCFSPGCTPLHDDAFFIYYLIVHLLLPGFGIKS